MASSVNSGSVELRWEGSARMNGAHEIKQEIHLTEQPIKYSAIELQ